ncbi:MAG: DUF6624 domain-containing protein [Planctomycetota bacterium]
MSRSPHLAALLPLVTLCSAAVGPAQTHPDLRAELLSRAAKDQAARRIDPTDLPADERKRHFEQWQATDRANTSWLREVVQRSGWPTAAQVGADGAHAAWILVQHADHDPAFQAQCLPKLREAVARGEGSRGDLAYLVDRVRVKQGKPQLYGTQYRPEIDASGAVAADANGNVRYLPPLVEDPEQLDERRRAAGLSPWRDYDKRMAEIQERAPFAEPRAAPAAAATTAEPPEAEPQPEVPWPFAIGRRAFAAQEQRGYLVAVLDLLAREAEAEAADSDLASMYWDVLATHLTLVGEHDRARRASDHAFGTHFAKRAAAPADALAGWAPTPALAAIVERAAQHRIVMLNEEHRSSVQRAFAHRLLEPLHALGFRYLALEAIAEPTDELHRRGHPVLSTGPYVRDPIFGDLIRRAIEMGWTVVAYEAEPAERRPRPEDQSPMDAVNRREAAQANHLYERTLGRDPDARVLVLGGRDHIAEQAADGWIPMGAVLRARSGLDPLSINQMRLVEHSERRYEHWAYSAADAAGWLDGEPVLLMNAAGSLWSHAPGALDATLLHPRRRNVAGRPHWMRLGDLRRPVEVTVPATIETDAPLLLQAQRAGEGPAAVPMDQVVLWPDARHATLLLRDGDYVLRLLDRDGAHSWREERTVH